MRRNVVLPLLLALILLIGAGVLGLLFLTGRFGGGTANQPVDEIATPTPVPVSVLAARIDFPAGTVITDTTLLEPVQISQAEFNAQPDQYFTSEQTSEVRGQLTLAPLISGQPILRSQLTEPGLSQQIPEAEDNEIRRKAYPLEVDNLTGVGDQIQVGDFVDAIMTYVFIYTVDGREFNYVATKTLVQNAQVLQVLRPAVAPAAEGEAAAPPPGDTAPPPQLDAQGRPITQTPEAEATLREGSWVLVLAVTDQDAELMEHARGGSLNDGVTVVGRSRIALVLRGAGDDVIEDTTGVSQDILFDQYGLPFPGSTRLVIDLPGQ